jgi:ATP-dependent DNA helicase DinG
MTSHLETLAPTNEIWSGPIQRCRDIIMSLEIITKDQDPASVYWYERRTKTVSLSATPIDITKELQDQLYSQIRTIVFTSATLSTGGNFNYFLERMGLPRITETLCLASPFDYRGRTRLYIPPPHFPEPSAPEYQNALEKQILAILKQTQGRALLLFTSIRAMKTMHAFLESSYSSPEKRTYPILVQGEAPKHLLLESFQQQTNSILLAVASFWEGVNVPGDSLSCVIIDKLPFEVPSDPVIMARIKRIKDEGGNPFFDFQIPRAILALRQGIGRLMRAASDRGIIAIMDIRLYSKGYGKNFLKSLPESPVIRDLKEISLFFREIR